MRSLLSVSKGVWNFFSIFSYGYMKARRNATVGYSFTKNNTCRISIGEWDYTEYCDGKSYTVNIFHLFALPSRSDKKRLQFVQFKSGQFIK
ncbi:hypothetical protein HZS_5378 [Henneguya salminicola]|nr:hypothetical protein HZS_5378 [Henneguya salminicola]